jgi:hypothetical protein
MTIREKCCSFFSLAVLCAAFAAPAHARIGDYLYACQVTTINDRQGYVAVRADTIEEAQTMANRSQDAPTRMDTWEAVKTVIECVQLPDGRFADVGFQDWVDNVLPR